MIRENVKKLLKEIPQGVELEAAAKTRTAEEITEAINAGIKIVGESYMRETIKAYAIGLTVAELDELFSLFVWNQGIGTFASEIGSSPLFAFS